MDLYEGLVNKGYQSSRDGIDLRIDTARYEGSDAVLRGGELRVTEEGKVVIHRDSRRFPKVPLGTIEVLHVTGFSLDDRITINAKQNDISWRFTCSNARPPASVAARERPSR